MSARPSGGCGSDEPSWLAVAPGGHDLHTIRQREAAATDLAA
jgi:hypothetical protein